MDSVKGLALAAMMLLASATMLVFAMGDFSVDEEMDALQTMAEDPLIQGEDHDHRDPTQHNMSSSNIEFADFNELTSPGNAEVQVMTCLLYTSPSPRDLSTSRMPSSA